MIRRNTWITLGAFIVVLAAAIWWTRARPSQATASGGTATPTAVPIWSLAETDLVGFRVEDLPGKKTVELKRDATNGWQVIQPKDAPADSATVEQAATSLLILVPTDALPAVPDLSPFGLAQPRYRLTVFSKDGVSRSISVGRLSPTGGSMYAQVPGRPGILLVSQYAIQDALNMVDSPPYLTTPTRTVGPGTTIVPEGTATSAPTSTLVPVVTDTPGPTVTP
ncbi:MAG: DUF4340 domain-containing protein [Actinobacteria bacterium]|nr:DUF4340 domain-containing protein [Actinomycetota bacterium]